MRKKLQFIAFFIAGLAITFSQTDHAHAGSGNDWDANHNIVTWDEERPDSLSPWRVEFRGGLNGSQASFRNWQSGGVNTLAVTSSAVFNAQYRKNKWGYNLNVNLKYGKAKLDDEIRKTDDLLGIRNQFKYFFPNEKWGALLDVNFTTQFDEGFDRNNEFVTSKFMSPAYLTQLLGITYQPVDYFNGSFGMSMKQTFVLDTGVSNPETGQTFPERYGLDPGDAFRNEAGVSFLFNFEKEIFENIVYSTQLETFTNVNRHVDRTDFTFSHELSGRINNYVSTNFQFVMHYNSDVIDKLQLKQVLSVGLTYRFI